MDGGRSAGVVVLVGVVLVGAVVAGLLAAVGARIEQERPVGRVAGTVSSAAPLTVRSASSARASGAVPVPLEAGAVLATPVVEVEPDPPTIAGCPWDPTDRSAGGPERHRPTVALAYCVLLDRLPDEEGAGYWTEQLDGGLRPAELVAQLTASPEYLRSRPGRDAAGWSPLSALAAIVASGRPASDGGGGGDGAGGGSVGEGTEGVDGLRIAQPLTSAEFDAWVAGRDLAEVDGVTPALVHGRLAGDGQRINVVYAHLSAAQAPRVSPAGRGRATVGTWAAEIGADAAVNGNWYAPWDGPAIAGGQVYGGADHGYTALFGFTETGDVVVEHHREINDAADPRVVEGLSGHPTLVYRGERTTDFGTDPTFLNRHPRTAIGLDRSGDVLILVTVDGRSSVARGMTGDETAQLMERLGAHDAVMLDGGGSTTMWIAGRGVVNTPSGSLRAVGNQIAVFGR